LRTSEKSRSTTTAAYLERINRAIDHIVTHLGEPLRLQELARVALLSPFHFHRVFQAFVGSTPADFVKRIRLEKALGLMSRRPPPSFTEIALQCGFASSSDFSRCFKQRFNEPPRAFDLEGWCRIHGDALRTTVLNGTSELRLERLPRRQNPDKFTVRIREIPDRSVAYIRVARPYQGNAVVRAAERLVAWAKR
jgi:AraC family transcriptional regulator